MYRVLALDPGGTTGWATFEADTRLSNGRVELVDGTRAWNCGQIGPEKHHQVLYNFIGDRQVANFVVVCESFEYRNRARPGLELISKEYIGIVELFEQARMLHNRFPQRLVYQTAAMAKGFVTDDNIKRLGLWFRGVPHAMDATRHLLYYLINTNDDKFTGDVKDQLLIKGWKT